MSDLLNRFAWQDGDITVLERGSDDSLQAQLDKIRAKILAEFSEQMHPRVPSGQPGGGRWTKAGGEGLEQKIVQYGWKPTRAAKSAIKVFKHPQLGKLRVYVNGPKAGIFHHMRPSAIHEVGRKAGQVEELSDYLSKLRRSGLPPKKEKPPAQEADQIPKPAAPKSAAELMERMRQVGLIKDELPKPSPTPDESEGGQFRLPGVKEANIQQAEEREKHLLSSSITDSQGIGLGIVGGKKILTFADGSKGVFKPTQGDKITEEFARDTPEQELAAWKVAKLVGMADMVSPVVLRNIGGRKGVVLEYQQGDPAEAAGETEKYDGQTDAMRAAAFDYVIGNRDRHDGNWLVDGSKLHLIDHGRVLMNRHDPYSMIITHVKRLEWDHPAGVAAELPPPSKFAEPYVKAKDKIRSTLESLRFPEENINKAMDRINELKDATHWGNLQTL